MEDGGPSGSAEIGETDSWTPLFEPEISELLCSFAFSHLGQHVVSRHSTVGYKVHHLSAGLHKDYWSDFHKKRGWKMEPRPGIHSFFNF